MGVKTYGNRRAAKAARSADQLAKSLLEETWIDAKVWQMVWAIFLYPNVPRDIEILKPKARRWIEDTDREIVMEIGIVGASDYIKIWVARRPVAFIILACGGSVDKLQEVSGKRAALSVRYRRLLNLDKGNKPLVFESGAVHYSGEVWFIPFNKGWVHAHQEMLWFAYRFDEGGGHPVDNREVAHRRRREQPLTVVAVSWWIKEAEDDSALVIRIKTEHEYPHKKKHLDKIVFTDETIRIRLPRRRMARAA